MDDHGDKIAQGIDKAAKVADQKTRASTPKKIVGGQAKAKEALDKLDGKNDGDLSK